MISAMKFFRTTKFPIWWDKRYIIDPGTRVFLQNFRNKNSVIHSLPTPYLYPFFVIACQISQISVVFGDYSRLSSNSGENNHPFSMEFYWELNNWNLYLTDTMGFPMGFLLTWDYDCSNFENVFFSRIRALERRICWRSAFGLISIFFYLDFDKEKLHAEHYTRSFTPHQWILRMHSVHAFEWHWA